MFLSRDIFSMSLESQSQQRKERLARLKNLKRKDGGSESEEPNGGLSLLPGRNFDVTSRDAKFGYNENPSENMETVEKEALKLMEREREQREADALKVDLDLDSIQPKRVNWDLKRDAEDKLAILKKRTDVAISKLVRQRLSSPKDQSGVEPDLAQSVKQREAEEDE